MKRKTHEEDISELKKKIKKQRYSEEEKKLKDNKVHSPQLENLTPKKFSLTDFQLIEHSVGVIQEQLKHLLELTPTQDVLNDYLKQVVDQEKQSTTPVDRELSGQIIHLTRSNKIQLAAAIKSLVVDGKAPLLSQIVNFTSTTTLQGQTDISLLMKDLAAKPKKKNHGSNNLLPALPQINDPALEARVFVHKSYNKDGLSEAEIVNSNNERLEWLGDAVLHYIVSLILYDRYPNCTESELHKRRVLLENNNTLERMAKSYGFHTRSDLLFGKGVTINGIKGFGASEYVDVNQDKGVSKPIADLFEAYIGALFVERGHKGLDEIKIWLSELYEETLENYDVHHKGSLLNAHKVKSFATRLQNKENESKIVDNPLAKFYKEIKPTTPHHDLSYPLDQQSKTRLYALVGSAKSQPVYTKYRPSPIPVSDGYAFVNVAMGAEILGTGEGNNFKEASARAAAAALSNKKGIERWHLLRMLIPKSETKIVEGGKDDGRDVNENIQSDNKPTTIMPPTIKQSTQSLPVVNTIVQKSSQIQFPQIVPESFEPVKNAKKTLFSKLAKMKIIPDFSQSKKDKVYETTLRIKGKQVISSKDDSKKLGQNRTCSMFLDLLEKCGDGIIGTI